MTFLVYTLLYIPCIATFSAEIKEVGVKWALFGLVLQLAVAYVVALLFHTAGLAFIINPGITVGVIVVALIAVVCVAVLINRIKNRGKCSCGCGSCSYSCAKRDKKSGEKDSDKDGKNK